MLGMGGVSLGVWFFISYVEVVFVVFGFWVEVLGVCFVVY